MATGVPELADGRTAVARAGGDGPRAEPKLAAENGRHRLRVGIHPPGNGHQRGARRTGLRRADGHRGVHPAEAQQQPSDRRLRPPQFTCP